MTGVPENWCNNIMEDIINGFHEDKAVATKYRLIAKVQGLHCFFQANRRLPQTIVKHYEPDKLK
jgi:hypothetical protein